MNAFNEIFAQGRAVLLQTRGTAAVHRDRAEGGTETSITIIKGQMRMAPAESGGERSRKWQLSVEVPTSVDEGGVVFIDRGHVLVIENEEWGVAELLEG